MVFAMGPVRAAAPLAGADVIDHLLLMPRQRPDIEPIVIESMEAFAAALKASLDRMTPEERAAITSVTKPPRHPDEDAYLRGRRGRNPWQQDPPMGPHTDAPADRGL